MSDLEGGHVYSKRSSSLILVENRDPVKETKMSTECSFILLIFNVE
jgi:hypothetical protein